MRAMMRGVNIGTKADIVIWDRNLYSAALDDAKNMKCLIMVLDGEVVQTAPDSPRKVGSGTDSR
jgi:hypothetical protein